MVVPAGTRCLTGTGKAGVDGARARGNLGPEEPSDCGAVPLGAAAGAAVPERPTAVRVSVASPPDCQEWRLGGAVDKLTIITTVVALEQVDHLAGVLELNRFDRVADL